MNIPTQTVETVVAKVIDFEVKAGDTFPVFKLKLSTNGQPMDLSEATALMEIKRDAADVKAAMTVPLIIAIDNSEVKSKSVDIRIVPGTYVHNVKFVFPYKTVTYFTGKIIVAP